MLIDAARHVGPDTDGIVVWRLHMSLTFMTRGQWEWA